MVKSSAYYELITVDEADVVEGKNLTRKFTNTKLLKLCSRRRMLLAA